MYCIYILFVSINKWVFYWIIAKNLLRPISKINRTVVGITDSGAMYTDTCDLYKLTSGHLSIGKYSTSKHKWLKLKRKESLSLKVKSSDGTNEPCLQSIDWSCQIKCTIVKFIFQLINYPLRSQFQLPDIKITTNLWDASTFGEMHPLILNDM